MITDTEIKTEGYKALVGALGDVQAEKFITLMMREPFDYTKWQKKLWSEKSVEDISPNIARVSCNVRPKGRDGPARRAKRD